MASKDTQFKNGNAGGPGRPKGARNKFSEAYVEDVFASWKKGGKKVIEKVMKERPDVYLRVVAQLLPKDLDVRQSGDVMVTVVSYAEMASDISAESLETEKHPEPTLIEGTAVDANLDDSVTH